MTRMVRLKPPKVNSGTLNRDRTFSEKPSGYGSDHANTNSNRVQTSYVLQFCSCLCAFLLTTGQHELNHKPMTDDVRSSRGPVDRITDQPLPRPPQNNSTRWSDDPFRSAG